MLKILHNPRCSKSNQALNILKNTGKAVEVRDYMQQPLSRIEIVELLHKLQRPASEIVRRQESLFQNKYAGQLYSETEWINLLVKHPELLQRPIIIQNQRAVIARPPEKVNELL